MQISEIKVEYIDHSGSDISVVNAARVSFHKESDFVWTFIEGSNESVPVLSEADKKLIYYLAKHKHFSPFNHCFISLRIKAPIFVARQLVKHEYMPWNEVSRRYVDSPPEFYIPKSVRAKAVDKKQGSGGIHPNNDYWIKEFISHSEASFWQYIKATEDGMCPEQARIFLPHNLMTEWIWSGTLGAFAKMLSLRLDAHTQEETRDTALIARDIVSELFPVSLEALLSEYK